LIRAPERVETERLILRRPRDSDIELVFHRYASDPLVTKFLSWPVHVAVAQTRAFLAYSDDEWRRWPAGPYLVFPREGGELVGGTGLGFEAAHKASTGYVLAKDAWGRGYATEALQAMVDVARGVGVRRLYAICHIDHRPSARVLEKCGFEQEAILRRFLVFPNLAGGPADVLKYSRVP